MMLESKFEIIINFIYNSRTDNLILRNSPNVNSKHHINIFKKLKENL